MSNTKNEAAILQRNEDQEKVPFLSSHFSICYSFHQSLHLHHDWFRIKFCFLEWLHFTLLPHTRALAFHHSVQTPSCYYMRPQSSLHAWSVVIYKKHLKLSLGRHLSGQFHEKEICLLRNSGKVPHVQAWKRLLFHVALSKVKVRWAEREGGVWHLPIPSFHPGPHETALVQTSHFAF